MGKEDELTLGEPFETLLKKAVELNVLKEIEYYDSLTMPDRFVFSERFEKNKEKIIASRPGACSITGHRKIKADKMEYVRHELQREIEKALDDGYIWFISGFADGTDIIFAEIVVDLKRQGNPLMLEAAIPYTGRLQQIKADSHLNDILSACGEVVVHSPSYHRGCFMKRNKYTVLQSERVIAVYDGRKYGGTYATINFALKENRNLRIIRI